MRPTLSTILLVEDESEIRIELKRFLQRYCSDIFIASNGEEGVSRYIEHKPDIVISDIKMPKMNGIDMAKKIKKISPNQAIIFTTAHSDNSYFLEAIEMQVDGYILKPVDLGLLKKKITYINKNIVLKKEKKLYESILDDIAQMQDTMLAVYDEKHTPVFYNKKLLTFFGCSTLQEFLEKNKSLSEKFEKNEESNFLDVNNRIHWIESFKKIGIDDRIVAMRDVDTRESKFFLVSISDKTENKNIIVTFSEITSIVSKKRQYRHSAYTDELTQIDNRARFNVLFEEMIKESKKQQSSLSIVLLDIDNFKDVNDRHGHTVGDDVLKAFTTLILKNIRSADYFFRWGGEEFVLLLRDTDLQSATKIAEYLRGTIEQFDFDIGQPLTCSFGIAQKQNKDTRSTLFKRVDQALYKAKNSGRNRVIGM